MYDTKSVHIILGRRGDFTLPLLIGTLETRALPPPVGNSGFSGRKRDPDLETHLLSFSLHIRRLCFLLSSSVEDWEPLDCDQSNHLSELQKQKSGFCSYDLSFIAKFLYILPPPYRPRAASQRNLKCCLLGQRSHFAPDKTELSLSHTHKLHLTSHPESPFPSSACQLWIAASAQCSLPRLQLPRVRV